MYSSYIGNLTQGDRMQPVGRIKEDFTFEYIGDNNNETVWPGKFVPMKLTL